jgi:polyhydroxybutyrate depolymerase
VKPPQLPGTSRHETILVGGRERGYSVFVPTGLPEGAPLLVVLHGSQQTGEGIRAATGHEFDELALRDGFVVVYPDGYRKGWNDGRLGSRTPARLAGIDDVGLFDALVGRLRTDHRLGPDVLAVGYSNGGQMLFRLLAEAKEPLVGVAVIGANLPVPSNSEFPPLTRPVRAVLIAGTADHTSPYRGGEVTLFGFSPRGRVTSTEETAATFAALHGADPVPLTRALPHRRDSGRTSVREAVYRKDGLPALIQYTIENGGHVVPTRRYRFPRIFGATTRDLDAPTAIWDFLAPGTRTAGG